jgi:hypothetical protein
MAGHKLSALVALTAAFALTAASTASATTIRSGSATGPAYSGSVSANLASATIKFTSTLSNVTCNQSTLGGSIASNGTALDISSANWKYNNGACQDSAVGTTTVSAQALPWAGGNVTYAPTAGGKDGTMKIANMSAKAVRSDGVTCWFKGGGTNNSVTMDVFNPDNANKPVAGNAIAERVPARAREDSSTVRAPRLSTSTPARSARGEGGGFDDGERGVRVMRGASGPKFDSQSLRAEPRTVKNVRSNLPAPFVLIPPGASGLPSWATMDAHMSGASRGGRWTGVALWEGRPDVGNSRGQ